MAKFSLTRVEIQDLVNRYRSELRKLQYQLEKTRLTINELEESLGKKSIDEPGTLTVSSESEPNQNGTGSDAKPAKKRGRKPGKTKAKAATPAKTEKKRTVGRPASKKTEKPAKKVAAKPAPKAAAKKPGRKGRLSEWDEFVLNSLKKEKKALINQELLDFAKDQMSGRGGKKLSEQRIKTKLNQSLHKLANKKKMVEKVSYSGRGYAYALPEWMGPSNVLKEQFRR